MSRSRRVDYVVCYDITSPRRLRRVHRCLRRWGIPLQYSVFYCQLNQGERQAVISDLRDRIDCRTDDVRIYGIQTAGAVSYLGLQPFPDDIHIHGFHQVCVAEARQLDLA